MEDACLGLCFEVHRAVKCGYFFLDDTDPDSMKDFGEPPQAPQDRGDAGDRDTARPLSWGGWWSPHTGIWGLLRGIKHPNVPPAVTRLSQRVNIYPQRVNGGVTEPQNTVLGPWGAQLGCGWEVAETPWQHWHEELWGGSGSPKTPPKPVQGSQGRI